MARTNEKGGKSLVCIVDRLEAIHRNENARVDPNSLSDVNIRDSVRRNLVDLLNSRIHFYQEFNDATLDESLISYGIPDFLGVSASTENGQRTFRRFVENAIERYEPRLTAVRVDLLSHNQLTERSVFLKVMGDLVLESGTEKVVFQSAVELKTNCIRIEQQR